MYCRHSYTFYSPSQYLELDSLSPQRGISSQPLNARPWPVAPPTQTISLSDTLPSCPTPQPTPDTGLTNHAELPPRWTQHARPSTTRPATSSTRTPGRTSAMSSSATSTTTTNNTTCGTPRPRSGSDVVFESCQVVHSPMTHAIREMVMMMVVDLVDIAISQVTRSRSVWLPTETFLSFLFQFGEELFLGRGRRDFIHGFHHHLLIQVADLLFVVAGVQSTEGIGPFGFLGSDRWLDLLRL